MLKILLLILISLNIIADEYDFDMSEVEPEPYEYNGYLRVDNKTQHIDKPDDDYQNYLHLEALLNFTFFHDIYRFKTSLMPSYDYIESKVAEKDFTTNELYAEAKLNTNHSVLIGKESLQWGKGYFFNPVAYFDRLKDPQQPTQTREGFFINKYSYNKSFSGDLKNVSFDFVYLPATESINKDYYNLITNRVNSNNIATRLYILLYDTDIDFIYNYSDIADDKIGIDFSKNIQTNFEIHGEFSQVLNNDYSYLLGLRYLTDFELTIISEYLYRSAGLDKDEIEISTKLLPFIAKDYSITLITQKEPFDLLYFSVYYKNMINLQDSSQQNKFGAIYNFKNNIDVDLSYNINSGTDLSEFGAKQISDFLWLRITWSI